MKTLIAAILLLTPSLATAEWKERVKPEDDVEIQNITLELRYFDSENDLKEALKKRGGCKDCQKVKGISLCKRNLEEATAHCIILLVRPKKVDDDATTSLGHEVMHGIYGKYHK